MRVATICICLVVMVALVCAQQQQSGKSGKHGSGGHKHHHHHKNSKVEAAVSHDKQGVKSSKNAKSKQSNIKAEWKTETLVVEVLPSEKSFKKASVKDEVPVVEKNAFGKKHSRGAAVDERRTQFAQKKERSIEDEHVDENEHIVEEEEQVIVPKHKKVVAKPVKISKKKAVDETKEKPCPCSAAKMEVDNEDVDESIDEVVETPCAAAKKVKVAKKAKVSACRKVAEEESSVTESPCHKKKSNCADDAILSCKKIAKATTKKVAVSTKPIKQCPLDAMVQCAKGWERDTTTGECKPATGCAVKKDKALKKIGIRLAPKHSVTVKQNDENNTDDLVVDIVSNDAKSDDEHEIIVTGSDDVEIIEDEESGEIVCEMCTRD